MKARSRSMEGISRLWLGCGKFCSSRPCMIFSLIAALAVFGLITAYSYTTADTARDNAAKVQSSLCGRPGPVTAEVQKNCSMLLTRIIDNPTPAQVTRMRQIVNGE